MTTIPSEGVEPVKLDAVQVKALEWQERHDTWSAECVIGDGYIINYDYDEDVAKSPWSCWAPDGSLGHFADLDEAKAAAQADYEASILSALAPIAPPPAIELVEAVARLTAMRDVAQATADMSKDAIKASYQHDANILQVAINTMLAASPIPPRTSEPVAYVLQSGDGKRFIAGSFTFNRSEAEEWVGPNGRIVPLYATAQPDTLREKMQALLSELKRWNTFAYGGNASQQGGVGLMKQAMIERIGAALKDSHHG